MEIEAAHQPMDEVTSPLSAEQSRQFKQRMPILTNAKYERYDYLRKERTAIIVCCGWKHQRIWLIEREMREIREMSLTDEGY